MTSERTGESIAPQQRPDEAREKLEEVRRARRAEIEAIHRRQEARAAFVLQRKAEIAAAQEAKGRAREEAARGAAFVLHRKAEIAAAQEAKARAREEAARRAAVRASHLARRREADERRAAAERDRLDKAVRKRDIIACVRRASEAADVTTYVDLVRAWKVAWREIGHVGRDTPELAAAYKEAAGRFWTAVDAAIAARVSEAPPPEPAAGEAPSSALSKRATRRRRTRA